MLPVTATSSSGAPVPTGASWPADVWVNGQRQLSQLRLQIPLFGVNMSVTETLSDYNSPVSVSPPPADQTANGTRLLQSGKLGQILGNSSAPSPSTTAPSATTSASREQIAASYTTVFDFANGTVSDKVAAIEAGSDLQQAIAQTVGSPIASSLSGAKIDSVADLDQGTCSSEGVSSPCARVDYDILGTIGTVVLPNNTGYATYQDGQWLVAKTTVCSVLGLLSQAGGTGTPPGC